MPSFTTQSIRVFISYSHEDQALIDKLVHVLTENGLSVLYSKKLTVGEAFGEEIKRFIEHAHVFMPVLTESASKRGWVHQEIGYAMGLHIPVFPVTSQDIIHGGLLQHIQTIKLSDDPIILKNQLNEEAFKGLLARKKLPAIYQGASRPEQRTKMMKEYAENISNLGESGLVRQKGGLSSFHIPNKYIGHQVWKDRYLPGSRTDGHKELQRSERIALQVHADKKGSRLIINPVYGIKNRNKISANARLKTLIEFLEADLRNIVIAIQHSETKTESLTMVGDWFLAESVSYKEGDGFTHTFFTRNASEISARIQEFDEELTDLLDDLGWTELNSSDKAVAYLKGLMSV